MEVSLLKNSLIKYTLILSLLFILLAIVLFDDVSLWFLGMGSVVIGVITVKLINYLFKNYKDATYSAIIGFSISTIVLMAIKCVKSNYTFLNLIIAFIMLFMGCFISKKINHYISND